MTIIQRRLYLFSFVVLFLVTAPVIVLFAKGYRFDSSGRIFVYSGSITIKSWPRDIDIYVNNKKQKRKKLNVINNSYTINGVRPGKYDVRCEKSGYTTWEKSVDVHSGISTEFWNVILFPIQDHDVVDFEPKNVEQFFLSPRKKNEIVFFSTNENQRIVSLLDTNNGQHEEIYKTDQHEFIEKKHKENIEWSSDNKRILIPFSKEGQKQYIIARIKKENLRDIINLNELFESSLEIFDKNTISDTGADQGDPEKDQAQNEVQIEKARWMFDKNDELVILTNDHRLFYFNIERPEQLFLLSENVSGYDFAGNRIYFSQLPNNIISEIKNDDIETKKQITNSPIPASEQGFISLIAYDQYRIATITQENELYVYNHDKEDGGITLEKIMDNVQDIQFSDDGKKLLYWSSNELWCLMLRKWEVQPLRQKGDRIFVTRLSSPLSNVQWIEDYENIIFSNNSHIKSASIDNRHHTNIVDILGISLPFEERNLIYSKSTQEAYYIKSHNGQTSLQSTLLIDKTGFMGF